MTLRTVLPRQALSFLLIGLVQLVLDTGVYVGLTALGAPVAVGNLSGRVAGACLGFWLNGRYTFARDGQAQLAGRQLLRFVVMWVALTVLSTLALAKIAAFAGLQGSWLAKPVLEVLLAGVGFVVQRQWVYR